ncbi:flagellar hook-length control protein FliK [Brevundimonas sp. G8]|uniref:flagellar hook-length control protein FliK n=1 Tax=Brevundimonas sp. G8 TaxID=1350776 RepID=UPI0012EFD265|nr:flagellar hook-length control protein FliK [Brevundimonas sp. G8]VXA91297.1 Flagellar hook-length control protein fliK [Brevundimonas sp. G8]
MSIASALFAPAAPVSTGTTAAGMGADMAEANLFSSKVALALDAGLDNAPVERVAPGRLTTAQSLGVVLTQAVGDETNAVAPDLTVEVPAPVTIETADSQTLPVASNETARATEDAANDDDAASVTITSSPFSTPQPTAPVAPLTSATPQSLAVEVAAEQTAETTPPTATTIDLRAPQGVATPTPFSSVKVSSVAALPTKTDVAASDVFAAPASSSTEANAKTAASLALPEAVQAIATELGDLLTTVKAAPASAAKISDKATADNDQSEPAQSASANVQKSPAEPTAAVRPMADAATLTTAAPDIANAAAQAAPADSAKPSAPSPIAQAMTAAQIPTAQVQISVAAASKPALAVSADIAAAVVVAKLSAKSETAAAYDQPAEAASSDTPSQTLPTPTQAAPPLKPLRHELAQQTSNAATTPVSAETTDAKTTVVETTSLADAGAASALSAKSTATTETAATPAPLAVAPTVAQTTSAGAADTQAIQQAVAPDRDLGLSTLSRATVETTAQLAAQIARRLDSRSTRFDMVLTPEDLGRVDVSLEIGKDGQLSARLAFDNPAAAADLKGRADELRRQLQDAGFQVAGDALDFSQRDPSAGNGGAFDRQQQRNALFAGGSRLAAQADTPIVPAPGAWINHSQTPERVDLKV